MKLWIDDVRPESKGYIWFKSVNEVIDFIDLIFNKNYDIINYQMKKGEKLNDRYEI